MSETPAISINQLTKRFEDFTAVDGINMQVSQGAFLVLLGPSGAEKQRPYACWPDLKSPAAAKSY